MLRERADLAAIGITLVLMIGAVGAYWPGLSGPGLSTADDHGEHGRHASETASLEPLAQWLRPGRTQARSQAIIQASPLADYRLIGLVETDDQTVVLVSGFDGVVSLRLGEQLDGFDLVEITARGARFARGPETVLLQLDQ
ncbi:hypothetical protein [Maricaulis sp.]|uniref:hypothetical protein n=1 Tax=Maricaulis sp. TaxID=1486257 RepID=UPI00262EEDB3|nr:hypothetical protein [Maricaulis sp.]